MTKHDLLDVIGQAQDKYILSAIRTRKQAAACAPVKTRRTRGVLRKVLIAAAILSLLAVTAYAAKYVGQLFATYFQQEHFAELSDGQRNYIEQNVQPSVAQPIVTEAENGYSVSVGSALTDGKIAYITIDIRAPEGVNLEGGDIRFLENPLLFPEPAEGLVLAPDGSSPDAMCDHATVDDGDGLSNTASVMFKVNPFLENENVMPFDGSIHWTMHAEGFEKAVFDADKMDFEYTPLAEGVWEFDLDFQSIDTRKVEFVAEPVSIITSDWIQEEYVHENQITSFALSGLSYWMELAQPEIDGEMQDVGDVVIVMKDGTQQTLLRLTAQSSSMAAPIILDEVDYILLSNGVKLQAQQ
ncbi:MAG TPA: DUF4179 domain-containing protein [Candidatus Faecousia faecavium]|nr:DUF4179 domain-containing protein [Candidatus Faecousia faecavium]